MMKVKIKTGNHKFFIPVPYFFLRLSIAALTSKKILALANNSIKKQNKTAFQIPELKKADLKPLLYALSDQKGLHLVETKLKDGTEVSITL